MYRVFIKYQMMLYIFLTAVVRLVPIYIIVGIVIILLKEGGDAHGDSRVRQLLRW